MFINRMSFICCTLTMRILMCINLTEANTSKKDCEAAFGYIDSDKDGFITKDEVERFMSSRNARIITNIDHGKFKNSLLQAIENSGNESGMDLAGFIGFMQKLDPSKTDDTNLKAVKEKFPGKTEVSREELAFKFNMHVDAFPEEKYTIP
ncbi:hypothetical protein LSTR_LSTR010874, partial [Laodelphax striatellus]